MATLEKAARLRHSKTYLPDQESEELLQFARVLNGINIAEGEPGHATLVAPDGKQVPIPAKLFQVLEEAANVLALGDGISILPYAAKLTTPEAEVSSLLGGEFRRVRQDRDPVAKSQYVG